MKQLLLLCTSAFVLVFSACNSRNDDNQNLIQSMDDVDYNVATEIIKANILEEYAGVFSQMRWLNNQIIDVSCDTTIQLDYTADSLSYDFSIPVELNSMCIDYNSVYFDRLYEGVHKNGNIRVNSPNFVLDIHSDDRQFIGMNEDEEKYFYGHNVKRKIRFISGVSEELNVQASFLAFFPSSHYDVQNLDLPDGIKASFTLELSDINSAKIFEGDIMQIGDKWFLFYKADDKVVRIK